MNSSTQSQQKNIMSSLNTPVSPVYNWMTTQPTLYKVAHPIDTKNAPRRWNFIRRAKRRRICGFGNSAADMVTVFPERKNEIRELWEKLYLK